MIARDDCSRSNETSAHHRVKSPLTITEMRSLGEDVYELELPYISLPRLRESIMPADWTRPPTGGPSTPTNGKTNPEPSPAPSRLTRDLADQILKKRR